MNLYDCPRRETVLLTTSQSCDTSNTTHYITTYKPFYIILYKYISLFNYIYLLHKILVPFDFPHQYLL